MKKKRGFTIIELMIVVAVIAVIASIAIPIYQDYMNRAKVAEAVNLLGGLKNPMVEYYHSMGTWPSISKVGGRTSGRYTSVIKRGGPGDWNGSTFYWIDATLKGGVLEGKQLRSRYILKDGSSSVGDWDCTTEGVSDPVSTKYLPAQCR
jgi:type IV pilus assembly protein PilA